MTEKFIQEIILFEKKHNLNSFDMFFPQKRTDLEIPEVIETKIKVLLTVGASPKLINSVSEVKGITFISNNRQKVKDFLMDINPKTRFFITFEENPNLEIIKTICLTRGIFLQIVSNKKNNSSNYKQSYLISEFPKKEILILSDEIHIGDDIKNLNFIKEFNLQNKVIRR